MINFYKHFWNNSEKKYCSLELIRIGLEWENVVALLLLQLKKCITVKKWQSWQQETCKRILKIELGLHVPGSEDTDDIKGFLSKALLVNAFLQIRGSICDFGIELADQALQHFLCFDEWEAELQKLFNVHKWLGVKVCESPKWRTLAHVTCGFFIVLNADMKTQTNAPLILGCGKVLQCYTLVALSSVAENVDQFTAIEEDAAQWLELLENQIVSLMKIVMQFSSNAHFRRMEVSLSHFKLLIKNTKDRAETSNEKNPSCNKSRVQSNINQWIQKKR